MSTSLTTPLDGIQHTYVVSVGALHAEFALDGSQNTVDTSGPEGDWRHIEIVNAGEVFYSGPAYFTPHRVAQVCCRYSTVETERFTPWS